MDGALPSVKVPVIGRTRTRLFVIFVLLLGTTVLIAVFDIPQLLRLRLESRTEAALDQEEVESLLVSEIRDLQTYGIAIMLGVVLLAGVCAWVLTGCVLHPARGLTARARAITESGQMTRAAWTEGEVT